MNSVTYIIYIVQTLHTCVRHCNESFSQLIRDTNRNKSKYSTKRPRVNNKLQLKEYSVILATSLLRYINIYTRNKLISKFSVESDFAFCMLMCIALINSSHFIRKRFQPYSLWEIDCSEESFKKM